MRPIITAFKASPDRGRGLARDMAVRWALEEVGLAYDVRLMTFDALKSPEHRALQPFGQIPTFEADDVAIFESGAIVLHVADQRPGLLPADAAARARAIAWMFAAVSTVEPPIIERSMASLLERDQPWFAARQALLDQRVQVRLADLSARLADGLWLDGAFSVGDLMMVAVLRRLNGSGVLEAHPAVEAYVARAEARPAFQRAFAAQRSVFEASERAVS
ncbi:glutathione S-transferase family protein [Caulobacter vibrioides]|uniref:Glutathione S-transferase family protein n=1 Tax=Caulobacter vibrioides TaxID=155892 RepID=A0A290MW01_CAUVI|nr:glutathione S-transferase family protein [Caulobacter vibrioides]ATC32540.1 glutathione S-transferase family protein [Caulobacter vibrioides]